MTPQDAATTSAMMAADTLRCVFIPNRYPDRARRNVAPLTKVKKILHRQTF
jgi:hypothetical protein